MAVESIYDIAKREQPALYKWLMESQSPAKEDAMDDLAAKIKAVRAKTNFKLPDYDPQAVAEVEAEKLKAKQEEEREAEELRTRSKNIFEPKDWRDMPPPQRDEIDDFFENHGQIKTDKLKGERT